MLLPIPLGIRLAPGAEGAASSGRSVSKTHADEALKRDDFTCRCCGFRSTRFQRVIPSEPEQKTSDAFITVCPFCEACFNLARAGMNGAGLLIWLPEFSQASLNDITRAAYIARAAGGAVATLAERALDALRMRRTEAKKRLGSDDPLLLATAFQENLSAKEYAARMQKLEGLRFLHADKFLLHTRQGDVDQFSAMLSFWSSSEGPYASCSPDKWEELFESVATA